MALQVTRKVQITPLVDIQSAEFARQYELGAWWSMHGDEQGKGLVSVNYFVTNLRLYQERGNFNTSDPYYLHHIGFFIGMYHGGMLSPHTGQRRPDVTTLALLDQKEAKRGYSIGRAWYFHEAEPQERRHNEQTIITRLYELVTEEPYQQEDHAATWYYIVGCLLGNLSGQVFPETQEERQAWEEVRRQWETEQVQEARVLPCSAILQEV